MVKAEAVEILPSSLHADASAPCTPVTHIILYSISDPTVNTSTCVGTDNDDGNGVEGTKEAKTGGQEKDTFRRSWIITRRQEHFVWAGRVS